MVAGYRYFEEQATSILNNEDDWYLPEFQNPADHDIKFFVYENLECKICLTACILSS
jgi:hypothetical protein